MSRKHNITIRLGQGYTQLLTSVSEEEEEVIRQAEREVNDLWQKWRSRFPGKESEEVMSLVAYRFAEFYFKTLRRQEEVDEELERVEARLDNLLHTFDADN